MLPRRQRPPISLIVFPSTKGRNVVPVSATKKLASKGIVRSNAAAIFVSCSSETSGVTTISMSSDGYHVVSGKLIVSEFQLFLLLTRSVPNDAKNDWGRKSGGIGIFVRSTRWSVSFMLQIIRSELFCGDIPRLPNSICVCFSMRGISILPQSLRAFLKG